MLKRNRFLSMSLKVLAVLGVASFLCACLWALEGTYNRPNPLMDYVPQELGIYDTTYENLDEAGCRRCHGNSLADRHHESETAINGDCIICHEVGGPQGVVVIHDCKTAGCHSSSDLANGWHHSTDLADSRDCTACHDPSLIAEVSPLLDFEMYPPTIVTPTPFSCENCHWKQSQSGIHPATYNHVDQWGNPVPGLYEYGIAIEGNYETHHMGFAAGFVGDCSLCHSLDPEEPSWNSLDPQLIRYCEKCHDMTTLHQGIPPHVEDTPGWEAVGAHVPDISNDNWTDVDPAQYRTFTANEMCFGCHADGVSETPLAPASPPSIDLTDGIVPNVGVCGIIVTLRGDDFGDDKGDGYNVYMDTVIMPIRSWTDTLIQFYVPCNTFVPGNYDITVVTPTGTSNAVNFTMIDGPTANSLSPTVGAAGQWITITGNGYGASQTVMYDEDFGMFTAVSFVDTASGSTSYYTALNYQAWSATSIDVRFYDYYIDENGNYVQDAGELTMEQAKNLEAGTYAVYIKSIYFRDVNADDTLDAGDEIIQVVNSDALEFTLAHIPIIYSIKPGMIERNQLLKIFGINFGTSQLNGGEVRYSDNETDAGSSTLNLGSVMNSIESWSNTRIKVVVDVPAILEGQTLYVWVENDEEKSDYEELMILSP